MGPTQVSNHTFFTSYLHSWVGETEPIQGAPQPSCVELCTVGLIHWATQPNKESIYLVSEGPRHMDLAEDGGTDSPKKLWCIRLIKADTDSITSPSPPAPPPPDDDPPEDEKRKDKPRGTPGPSELFRAMERLSSGLQGSTSQGGNTAPAPQSSSTLPQHSLGFNPDSAHANEGGKKINIPPGFIHPTAHVGKMLIFGKIILRAIIAMTVCPRHRLLIHLHHHRLPARLPIAANLYTVRRPRGQPPDPT